MARTFTFFSESSGKLYRVENKILNPKIWNNDHSMKEGFQDKLLEMSDRFVKELGLGKKALKEVRVVGGNASYAYSPKSDLDVTLILDPTNELSRKEFKALSKLTSLLNLQLSPTINGIDTNFFLVLRGLNNPIRNQSVYSVTDSKWIAEPADAEELDEKLVLQKTQELIQQIKHACESDDYECHERLLSRLKGIRAAGLRKEGELGFANQVWRQLSRSGEIQALKDHMGVLKKMLYTIQTEGVLPERPYSIQVPVARSPLTIEGLEALPREGNPTNAALWDQCLEEAEYQLHTSARIYQVAEAANAYYKNGGRWVAGHEETCFLRVDAQQVQGAAKVTESTASRLTQNILSESFSKIAASSRSDSSRKVLGEMSLTGNNSVVGDVLTELVQREHGTHIACNCERHDHPFYKEIGESFVRGLGTMGKNADRLMSLSSLFTIFED